MLNKLGGEFDSETAVMFHVASRHEISLTRQKIQMFQLLIINNINSITVVLSTTTLQDVTPTSAELPVRAYTPLGRTRWIVLLHPRM